MRRTVQWLVVLVGVWACAYAGMVLSTPVATAGEAASGAVKCSTMTCSATLRCCAPYACHRGRCLID